MTDLEENCWSEKVCQTCGSQLGREQHTLTFSGGIKIYCSQFCSEQGQRLMAISAPVFSAPAPMHLRDRLLRAGRSDS